MRQNRGQEGDGVMVVPNGGYLNDFTKGRGGGFGQARFAFLYFFFDTLLCGGYVGEGTQRLSQIKQRSFSVLCIGKT